MQVNQVVDRNSFKAYCLRRLGSPVIQINVSDDQVEDRIDDALKFFQDYHFDATQKAYVSWPVTSQLQTQRYVDVPDDIVGITRIFQLGNNTYGNNIFDFQYQVALNDLYTLTSHSMVPYFTTMQHLQFMENLLVGQKPIRFNKHTNKLYVDANWANLGGYIVAECTQVLDPDTYPDIWADRWLQRYATQLIRRQWGQNLSKFQNIQMPGGVTFNGQQIYEQSEEEIIRLEEEMIEKYSEPMGMFIG